MARGPGPPRLSRACLTELARRGVDVPTFDLDHVTVGQVHIGPGVFHRAHQAVYADRSARSGARSSGICAISMRSARLRDAMRSQDHLYVCVERSDPATRVRVIGSIREVLVATDDVDRAIERLTDPLVTIVTMTVTEAGYCFAPSTMTIDTSRPEVEHDLSNPEQPVTMPGLLVAALARRRDAGTRPFAIVPCDNLGDNGTLARTVIGGLAARRSSELASWIDHEVPFCSTMVDRLVPATTGADLADVTDRTGCADAWPVVTEPFTQWVVQEHPAVDLSAWADVGVEVVADVGPHERLKLRVLNGAHSALAYLGLRAGHATISAALADPPIGAAVRRLLVEEVVPCVEAPPRTAVARYLETTLARFANAALDYSTAKVASDGSLKLTQRLLPTVQDRLVARLPVDGLASVFAAWLWCTVGPRAVELDVRDPQRRVLASLVGDDAGDHQVVVRRLLISGNIFGPTGREPPFVDAVLRSAASMWDDTGSDAMKRAPT